MGEEGGRGGGHCSCSRVLIGNEMEVKQGLIKLPSIKRHLKREIFSLLSLLVSSCNNKYITGIISDGCPRSY